ncbi:MAG: hypothetical protein RhofKO_41020 [Rhodothermales bacterium]
MSDSTPPLHERVERLEVAVAELRDTVRALADASVAPEPPPAVRVITKPVKPPRRPKAASSAFELPQAMQSSEYWLSRLGIGLILFGLAFLFKYSIDQGWLTPMVRVGFGLVLGLGLLGGGLRLSSTRRHFSQILLGGSIATFYITTFAASEWFDLISYAVAFRSMIGVTLLAFVLALTKDGAVLAIIGTLGGLATPFVLYTDTANIPGLMAYTCVILSGALAVFAFKGWRPLLGVVVLGGWAVLASGAALLPFEAPVLDRWAVQGGIVFALIGFGVVPLARHALAARSPEAWPSPGLGGVAHWPLLPTLHRRYLHLLVVSTPLIALSLSTSTWSLTGPTWGWITLAVAALYGLGAWGLSRTQALAPLAYTHALVGTLLATLGLVFLLDGEALLFAIVTEAAILHLLAHRLNDRGLARGAHALFVLLALTVAVQLSVSDADAPPVLNAWGLAVLWTILLGAGVSYVLSGKTRLIYLMAAHVFFLGWLLRELSVLPEGQAYVTISWGIYTLVLLVIGLRHRIRAVRLVAMGTLLLVIGKLFLVDLAELEAIWRILLFLGFGGVLLAVSYYVQRLWGPNEEEPLTRE